MAISLPTFGFPGLAAVRRRLGMRPRPRLAPPADDREDIRASMDFLLGLGHPCNDRDIEMLRLMAGPPREY
jgi:hypothetical protein